VVYLVTPNISSPTFTTQNMTYMPPGYNITDYRVVELGTAIYTADNGCEFISLWSIKKEN